VYSLTARGKKELVRRLTQFNEKEAAFENEFRLRVGLFSTLDVETRKHILVSVINGWQRGKRNL